MPTRNVVLTDRQDKLIDRLVKAGNYQNASEVLRDGLRLLEARAAEDAARLAGLRAAAEVGLRDIEAGRFVGFNTRTELASHLVDRTESILSRPRKSRASA